MARSKTGFFFVKTLNGAPPAVKEMPCAATHIYEGAPLRVTSTGGSASNFVADGTAILGVAQHALTTAQISAGSKLMVYLADDNSVFEGRAIGMSAAPQGKFGDLLDIDGTAGENYRISSASSKQIRVVGWNTIKIDGSLETPTTAHTGVRFWVTMAKGVAGSETREPRD